MAREGWSIETRLDRKMPLPAWYAEGEPQIHPFDEFYLEAFWHLCTERQFGYTVGPIPWSSIEIYANSKGLDYIMKRVFHLVLRELDEEYTRYNKAKNKN